MDPTATTNENGELRIVPEPSIAACDRINVAAGGKLIVPAEDISAGLLDVQELDLIALQAKKIRKPQRREFFMVNVRAELQTRLLVHKENPEGMDEEFYYVSPQIRGPIADELKMVRVFPCWSVNAAAHFLWIVKVTPGGTWYESLLPLLQKPPEFFDTHSISVRSAKPYPRYRIKLKPATAPVTWLAKATEILLGEALGQDKIITKIDHPIYQESVSGEELT